MSVPFVMSQRADFHNWGAKSGASKSSKGWTSLTAYRHILLLENR